MIFQRMSVFSFHFVIASSLRFLSSLFSHFCFWILNRPSQFPSKLSLWLELSKNLEIGVCLRFSKQRRVKKNPKKRGNFLQCFLSAQNSSKLCQNLGNSIFFSTLDTFKKSFGKKIQHHSAKIRIIRNKIFPPTFLEKNEKSLFIKKKFRILDSYFLVLFVGTRPQNIAKYTRAITP